MDSFDKYEVLKDKGLDPTAIYLTAEKDGLPIITIIRLLRKLFNLSLGEAKAVVGVDNLLSPQAKQHILFGDERGGGHANGSGFSSHYMQLEIQIKAILFELRLQIPDAARVIVEQETAVKEYGLAFEYLCSFLERNYVPIPLKLYGVIAEVGKSMLINPTIWESLNVS